MSQIRFTESHEYIRVDGETGTVGVTEFAQEQLGDVVHVELPETGRTVSAGEEVGVVESVKSANEIYSPVGGEIVAANDGVTDAPEQVNDDPLGAAWFFQIKLHDPSELDKLMDESAYSEYVKGL